MMLPKSRLGGFGKYSIIFLAVALAGAAFLMIIISSGRTSGMEDFHLLVREDPLFASSEIDCSEMSIIVAEIKGLHTEIYERLDIRNNIIPVDFLNSICVVDQAQRSFIEDPRPGSARKLIAEYKKTRDFYEKDIRSLKEEIERLIDGDDVFITVSTFTTGRIILEDLELMIRNSVELEKEIAFREEVLKGKERYYPAGFSGKLSTISDFIFPTGLLSKEELFYPSEYAELKDLYGAQSSCFGNSESEDYFYVYRYLRNNKPVFNLKLATGNYYSRHNPTSELIEYLGIAGDYPGDEYIYVPSKETNIYNCRDVDYQLSVMAMDLLMKEGPFLRNIIQSGYFNYLPLESKNFLVTATYNEEDLFSREIISERDFSIIGEYYLDGYRILRDSNLPNVAQQHRDELLIRHLMTKNKMKGIETLFNNTLFLDVIKVELDKGNFIDFADLYAIRSNYPLAFLNFSPAVWRIGERPEYGEPLEYLEIDRENILFETYDNLLEKYEKNKILMWHNIHMKEWHKVSLEKLTD